VCLASFLKPWPIHIEPRQGVRGPLVFIEKLFAIETVAGVAIADVQNHSHARDAPVCFPGRERDNVHLRRLVDYNVQLLWAVHSDCERQLDVGSARRSRDEGNGRAYLTGALQECQNLTKRFTNF